MGIAWTQVIVAALVCATVLGAIATIAVAVNADTIVRAYKRWQGETVKDPCKRCDGSGEES